MHNITVRNKKYLLFVAVILVIGLLLGFIYYYFLDVETKNNLVTTISNINNFRYNFIIKDLVMMSLLLVTSFFIVGLPLSIFYLFYEVFAIGFLLNIFFVTFNLPGLLYILIFVIVNKVVSLILKIIFLHKTINISRYLIGNILYKNSNGLKSKILINFKNALYIIIFCIIFNIILYFISPIIFKNLSFLL